MSVHALNRSLSAPVRWRRADGSIGHAHGCVAEVRQRIAECRDFVTTGCTRPVLIDECPLLGDVISVEDLMTGEPHLHAREPARRAPYGRGRP